MDCAGDAGPGDGDNVCRLLLPSSLHLQGGQGGDHKDTGLSCPGFKYLQIVYIFSITIKTGKKLSTSSSFLLKTSQKSKYFLLLKIVDAWVRVCATLPCHSDVLV